MALLGFSEKIDEKSLCFYDPREKGVKLDWPVINRMVMSVQWET